MPLSTPRSKLWIPVLAITFGGAVTTESAAQQAAQGRDAPAAVAKPEIFDGRPYLDAKQAAEEAGKWFIVKATAVWCGPCRQMDRTTWVDPKVVEWLREHAIVYALDTDVEPDLARSMGIRSIPTTMALRGGEEFDRVMGNVGPQPFVAWLAGIDRGEKRAAPVRNRGQAPDPNPRGAARDRAQDDDGPMARYQEAQQQLRDRKFDEATDNFEFLWGATADAPGFGGVRGSFMASDMKTLAARHPAARERFLALRNEARRALDAAALTDSRQVWQAAQDWMILNEVVNEPNATLAWFDQVKDDPSVKPLLARLHHRLNDMLKAEGRWADLGELIDDPESSVRVRRRIFDMAREGVAPDQTGLNDSMWRKDAAEIHAAVLAAGRREEARQAAVAAMELDTDPKMLEAIVAAAQRAKAVDTMHREWLIKAIEGAEAANGEATKLPPAAVERLQRIQRSVEAQLGPRTPADAGQP
ncbi:MAG: thioredoxin family protein [Phycisphaeraceae bacterium]|nr:thioredoxin family protein [Phycisphaeraceae bacterium]